MIKFSTQSRKWIQHIWLYLLPASAVFAQVPVITSAPTYSGEQGLPLTPPYTITATNSPDVYGVTGLDSIPGLTQSGNEISGVPTEFGFYSFDVSASNGSGTGSLSVDLTINKAGGAAPVPEITSADTIVVDVSDSIDYDITALGTPDNFDATGLGALGGTVAIDTGTGEISGSPGNSGTFDIVIEASNPAGTDTQNVRVIVTPSISPTVTITNPSSGDSFLQGDIVNVVIQAPPAVTGDPLREINLVEVFDGSTSLGNAQRVGASDEFQFSLDTGSLSVGLINLRAEATDAAGDIGSSPIVPFSVTTGAAPTVSIDNPGSGDTFTAGDAILVEVTATDADGTISQVEIFDGTTSLGLASPTGTAGKYVLNLATSLSDVGLLNLQAQATDDRGNVSITGYVQVSVGTGAIPAVSIDSPGSGATFTAGDAIPVEVTATDADGTISQVEIFDGTTSLGLASPTGTAGKYVLNLATSLSDVGLLNLQAQATDDRGNVSVTGFVQVSVATGALPTVSIDNPGSGDTFTVGDPIPVEVTATDADGTVTQVEIFDGTTSLGLASPTGTAGGYVLNLTTTLSDVGLLNLQAQATDDRGNVTPSPFTQIQVVAGVPPVVEITAPLDGNQYVVGDILDLEIDASDSDGTITTVRVLAPDFNGVLQILGAATSAGVDKYSFSIRLTEGLMSTFFDDDFFGNPNYGNLDIIVFATDNDGAVDTDSIAVGVLSNPDDTNTPVVSITSPPDNAQVVVGDTLALEIDASDSNGPITTVQVLAGGNFVGFARPAGTGQYAFDLELTEDLIGNLNISVIATDNDDAVDTDSITVGVLPEILPEVTIDSPLSGSGPYEFGTDIPVEITASDADGAITQVLVYNGPNLLGIANRVGNTSFSFDYTPDVIGFVNLQARATDDVGNLAVSAIQQIEIVVPQPPVVEAPQLSESSYKLGAAVPVTIEAASSVLQISKVELFANGNLVAETTFSSNGLFQLEWEPAAAGSYALTARATDSLGGETTSASTAVTITDAPIVSILTPTPSDTLLRDSVTTVEAAVGKVDASSSISVEFFVDGLSIGTDDSAPYTAAFTPQNFGSVTIEVEATEILPDSTVLTAVPASVTVFVSSSTTPTTPTFLKVSEITGLGGTYAVGDTLTFTFTAENEAELEEIPEGDDVTDAEKDAARARNEAKTVRFISFRGNLAGVDIYGNEVEIPVFLTSSPSKIEAEGTGTFAGRVEIPFDGTLHRLSDTGSGYGIVGELNWGSIDVNGGFLGGGNAGVFSERNVYIDVPANLKVVDLAYPVKTFRGGEIIEITASIRNERPFGTIDIVRPITSAEDFRTDLYLTDDASVDSGNDFLLGFFTIFGDLSGFMDGRDQTRVVGVDDTPIRITSYSRDYTPQPDDGFLDIGETVSVTLEVMIPENFPGTYFAAAYTDSLRQIIELEEDVDASFDDQGDNVWVDDLTPLVRIESDDSPTTLPVSEVSDETGGLVELSDGVSDNPSVSEDGKFVVFQSTATNLDPDLSGTGNVNIYLRDVNTGEVTLVSRNNSGELANRDSLNPVISANGRYIAYESLATNLVSGPQGAASQIYVYDVQDASVVRISTDASRLAADGSCYRPSISQNGRFVAFESLATSLDPDHQAALDFTGGAQIFVHDRDPKDTGAFDDDRLTHLISELSGNPADEDAVTPKISLDGRGVVFASRASNLGVTNSGFVSQVWYRELGTDGEPTGQPILVSVNTNGDPGNGDSLEPAINGGPSSTPYGLQIAFASYADDLISADTNQIADIFVRDWSNPATPVTVRVSVSNPRVAYGTITFEGPISINEDFNDNGMLDLGEDFNGNGVLDTAVNLPDNQPQIGDTITLNDGSNEAVFEFDSAAVTGSIIVPIAATTGETRDNLVDAINNARLNGDLNIVAYASDPPLGVSPLLLDGHTPTIQLFNTEPGEPGNQPIETTSEVLFAPGGSDDLVPPFVFPSGMSGGGEEIGIPSGNYPGGLVFGSLQPSLDRSGKTVAFRSLTGGTSVIRDANRVFKPDSVTEATPRVGEIIRPLRPFGSNVYVRDRDLSESGTLDAALNTETTRASVNKFGYKTNQLLDTADSASSRMPALSANGRFVAFASDATNTGGLRFDRTNRQPLDSNNKRDIFVRDRNISTDVGGGSVAPEFISPTAPVEKTVRNAGRVIFNTEVSGVAPIRYQWRKDGENISNDSRIKGATGLQLELSELQPGDAGSYTLSAQNDFGVATSQPFVLTVGSGDDGPVPLTIGQQPQSKGRAAGGSARFEVQASSSEAISYQWIKDGVDLVEGTNVTGVTSAQLQLTDLTTADAGNYQVRVETASDGPLLSSIAVLVVEAAPVITTQPQALSLSAGESGQLKVETASPAGLSYQWFKDGTAIPGADSSLYSIEEAASIDAGDYSVQITNDVGSTVVSQTAVVQVTNGTSSGSLPAALQGASSLGGNWYYLPWYGAFAQPNSSNWIYRMDLGWIYLAEEEATTGFWSWSTSMSGWLWTSQNAAANGFYYDSSEGTWVFILAKSSGIGAWIRSMQTGVWTELNP